MVEARVQRAGERLAASDEGAPSPPAVSAVVVAVLLLGLVFHVRLDNLLDVANLDEHVLGLEIGVDDAALAVEVVEAEQHLLGDLLDERHGDAAVVPALDEAEQVLAEDLEDHADVDAIGALVVEGVEQADDVFPARVVLVGVDDLFQQLDLVEGRLGVVGGRADDLEGDVLAICVVARQPDGGEVAPAELADNGVLAVLVVLADLDGVVAALAVVLRILLVGGVVGLVGRGRGRVGRVGQRVAVGLGVRVEGRARGGGGAGRGIGALGGDDGLEVLALPPLLAAVAVGGLGDLLGLVDGRLFDVGAIHRGGGRGGEGGSAFRRSGRVGQRSWATKLQRGRGRRAVTSAASLPSKIIAHGGRARTGNKECCRRTRPAISSQLLESSLSAPLARTIAVTGR